MTPSRIDAAAEGPAGGFLFEFAAMGTACSIRLCGVDEGRAGEAAALAIAEVRRIEAKYSRYRPDSVVSRMAAFAGTTTAFEVDGETADLLDFAARMHLHSDGLFDITTGVLRRAWDFRAARVPDAAVVQAVLACVGWAKVDWRRPHLVLTVPGMELDFGGFGKEYAADRAGTLLVEQGIAAGLVNLGGDIRVIGPRPDGQGWSLGIAHPRQPDQVIAGLELRHGGLATSGDGERFFEADGRRYCHILEPHSGWPVQHWQSISVCAPSCLAAGALSTIAMLKGPAAHDFLRSQGVEFLTIGPDGALHQETP